MNAYNGGASELTPALARMALTRRLGDYGLGFFVRGDGPDFFFGHGGDNPGFHASLTVYPGRRQGIALMTNGDGGYRLMTEFTNAVRGEYGWPAAASDAPQPNVAPTTLREAPVTQVEADVYIGDYVIPGVGTLKIQVQAGSLVMLSRTAFLSPRLVLEPLGGDSFTPKGGRHDIHFRRKTGNRVDRIIMDDVLQAFPTGA